MMKPPQPARPARPTVYFTPTGLHRETIRERYANLLTTHPLDIDVPQLTADIRLMLEEIETLSEILEALGTEIAKAIDANEGEDTNESGSAT